MVYIAFGLYAGKYHEWLFDDPIKAWKYGPVVPALYDKLKQFERAKIPVDAIKEDVVLEKKQTEMIDLAIGICGGCSAVDLVDRTHKCGSPWEQTALDKEIDKELISSHYAKILGMADVLKKNKKTFEALAGE